MFPRLFRLSLAGALAATLAFSALPVPTAHAAMTITVNTNADDTTDDGFCTLREAIIAANTDAPVNGADDCDHDGSAGMDTITIPAGYTIRLSSTLPTVTSALTINGDGNTTISGDTNNDGTGDVRVMVVNAGADLTLQDLTVTKGYMFGDGGGIHNSGTLTVNNSTFSGNRADTFDGGGIYNSGTLTITNNTFSGNSADGAGSGIRNVGTLSVSNSTFSGNSATNVGGGIANGGTLTVTNSTFSGNSADIGGGIENAGTLTVSNSTFSGNSGSLLGGGIYNSGTLTVTNSTVSGNSAISGGGIRNSAGTVTLKNTIVANSTAGGDCLGGATDGGNNIVEDNSCGFTGGVDPNLGALTGSPAYFPLNAGSAAIDAGNDTVCAAVPVNNTSQNGVVRPADGDGNGSAICDIGSYEAPTPPPPPPPTPFVPPTGAQPAGSAGGSFVCGEWTITIPAGVVPDGGALHCGPYDPNFAPGAGAGFRLLGHVINVNLYNPQGQWITSFTPPLTLCFTYSDADLLAAGGDPNNFVVQTAPIGGVWSDLTTTVDTAARRVCGTTGHLTLFGLSARAPTALPTTGADVDAARRAVLAAALALLGVGLGALAWKARRAAATVRGIARGDNGH